VPRPVHILHADPARGQFVRDASERYPPSRAHPIYDAITSRAGVFHEAVDDATLERMAVDATHLAILRRHGPRSLIIVPLESQGRVMAAVTLSITSRSRRFTSADYIFVCELGLRVSAALTALTGAGAHPREGLRSDVAPSPTRTTIKPGSTLRRGRG
jgi:GAF domain-containing protein